MNSSEATEKNPINFILRTLQSNWFYLAILVFLIAFPHIVGWVTGDSPFGVRGRPRGESIFWQGIFVEVFVFTILAMSYNLIFGFTGVISFGHALFFGLGGYTVGLMLEYTPLDQDSGLILGAIVAIGVAGIVGFVMGLVTLRLKGVYFAIFTLALAEMAFIYVGRWQYTNAEDGFTISNVPDLLNSTRNRLDFYYFAMICAVLTFLLIRRLMNSPTGRVLLAIRENEDRAQTMGYNVLAYKLMAITLASMLAGLAGVINVIFNKKVGPEIMSVTYTLDPLLMVIIGGIGTFSGPILGAAGLHLTERIFNREFEIAGSTVNIGEYWSLVIGSIFVIVVLLFPYGIAGTWLRWRAQFKKPGRIRAVRQAVTNLFILR